MTGRDITNYDQAYAEAAEAAAKRRRGGGGLFFSTAAGVLRLGDDEMPGNQIAVVIADDYLENQYFVGEYDADNITPPTCYAQSRGEEKLMFPDIPNMIKTPTYFMPQNVDKAGKIGGCDSCPKNAWKSAPKGGGKACKNIVRLATLPAGIYSQAPNSRQWDLDLFDSVDHFATVDVHNLKVPVTSTRAFEKYSEMLRVKHGRTTFGAVTRIYLEKHKKYQFTMHFELIELLPSHLDATIFARQLAISSMPLVGYEAPELQDRPSQRFGANSNLRRR